MGITLKKKNLILGNWLMLRISFLTYDIKDLMWDWKTKLKNLTLQKQYKVTGEKSTLLIIKPGKIWYLNRNSRLSSRASISKAGVFHLSNHMLIKEFSSVEKMNFHSTLNAIVWTSMTFIVKETKVKRVRIH